MKTTITVKLIQYNCDMNVIYYLLWCFFLLKIRHFSITILQKIMDYIINIELLSDQIFTTETFLFSEFIQTTNMSDYASMKIAELKKELKAKGLPVSGKCSTIRSIS